MVESPLRKGHRQHKTSGLVHGLGHLIWRNKVHVYQVGWLGEYSLVHQLSSMVPPVVSPYNLYDSIKKKVICKMGKSWIVYPYWGMSINKLTNKDLYTDCKHSHSHYGMDDHKHQKPYTILVWRRWREGDIQCFDPYARLPTIRSRYFAYMYGFLWYETHTHIYIYV